MSVALQRVIVRMLFDPPFVARVYDGEPLPELDARARALLLAVDRGAWGTDPHRRARALTALLEEFPASAALAGLDRLDAFFSSPTFHRAIQARQSLAQAFGGWLLPLAGPVATLESVVAAARRDRSPPPGPGLVRAPGVRVLRVSGGTLARYQQVRARLGPDPLRALAAGPIGLPRLAPLEGEEILLLERNAGGSAAIGACADGLASLITLAARPLARELLLAEARRLGADPGEDAEIVDGLVSDGILVSQAG